MNIDERDALEARLSDQLGVKVILDDYMSEGLMFLFNMTNDTLWTDEEKEWVALRADEASTLNVSEAVKNVIRRNLREMTRPLLSLAQFENLK